MFYRLDSLEQERICSQLQHEEASDTNQGKFLYSRLSFKMRQGAVKTYSEVHLPLFNF